jgi:hypothetical protein
MIHVFNDPYALLISLHVVDLQTVCTADFFSVNEIVVSLRSFTNCLKKYSDEKSF